MKVLAVNQFYAPDHAATSQLLTELCEDLAALGEEVTVIASRGRYFGGDPFPAEEVLGGVRVVRPWATSLGKASVARRLADYGSFWVSAVASAATQAKPDVMLALTTPPLIGAGAAVVAAARRTPLVTWVQDVYPDVAVSLGVVRGDGPTLRLLRGIARATHAASRTIVALSSGMADRLRDQGAAAGRIEVVPNWSDGRAVRPIEPEENAFRREHGLAGRFVAMYSGNLGMAHDVATFVAAARRLEARCPELVLVFVGDGARRAEAERLAAGSANVRFFPYQPRGDLAASLSAADVHLISLRDGLEGLVVPSKLYGALASGRPAFYVGPPTCEVAQVIDRHDLGWAGRLGDDAGLAANLEAAARSRTWCVERGERARRIFSEHFDRPIAVRRWRSVLARAAR